ncbi:transcription initiation factor IIF, beta subunit [Gorgonomyces haynaldii]|nr:transcription initiation factor IIF, beta subunit [Gorgonomyces haynaldii]
MENKMEVDEYEDSDDETMLDLNRKDTKVWLVKIPEFVAKEWKRQPKGTPLGKLRIKSGQAEPKITVHLPQEREWAQSIPKNYNLTFTSLSPQNEFIFTENSSGKAVDIAGKVEHEATVGPIMDDDYHRVMKNRSKEAMEVTRVAKELDNKDERRARIDFTKAAVKDNFMKKKVTGERRERLPEANVLDMLFPAFQQRDRYNIKALTEITQQPQQWLKEILSKICILHKRGPYTGLYELKPEYKDQKK